MSHISSKQFDYDSKKMLFSAEISTLSHGSRIPVFRQIYQDACDEGFTMVSDKTGKSVDYVVVSIDYTHDGEDIGGWRLEPTAESKRKVPECARTRVLIIND